MKKPAIKIALIIFSVMFLFLSASGTVSAQHEGHQMPAVKKAKPKAKAKRNTKRKPRVATATRRKPRGSKSQAKREPKKPVQPAPHPPHVTQPAVPAPSAPTHTHSVDMHTPAAQTGPSPAPTAAPHVHAPPTPTQSPTEVPTQPVTGEHQTHTHQPAEPAKSRPATIEHAGHDGVNTTDALDPNSPMLMSGEVMGIRVGKNSLNVIPMGQMGSGTSWQPASTQMNMIHKAANEWLLMFHYNAFVGVNSSGGRRGVTRFESANWFMPMAFRRVGSGTLELRGMFSFEAFTFPKPGSPLLFQTGETYKGQPIIDAQHPHDLFMELSASYTVPIGDRATWFAYVGYPGEPALGPTAFMHRASASENPSAALSHHLQDSSHITFGVFTTGFTYRWFKLEGSVFNGREPDENRYNFEAHPWTSRSARLSFAPNSNWSMQVSHGFLRNPEALEPGDVRRTTASVSYNKPLDRGYWASSFIWGRNHENHDGETFNLNGFVGESTVNFADKNYVYTRLESVDKNSLLRAVDRQLLGITEHHPLFRISAYTFGGARDFYSTENVRLAIGGDVTFYSKPSELDVIYGNNPVSYRVHLRIRPGKMSTTGHGVGDDGMKH